MSISEVVDILFERTLESGVCLAIGVRMEDPCQVGLGIQMVMTGSFAFVSLIVVQGRP
jgi:hypothetical protein